MKKIGTDIPVEVLHERFAYDPETGVLVWKKPGGNRKDRIGKAITAKGSHGYLVAGITHAKQERLFLVHRIAFAMHYGFWPEKEVDHVNGDRTDNRAVNLRQATSIEQGQNKKWKLGKSDLPGIYWNNGVDKWQAQITYNDRRIYLGIFDDKEEAHQTYLAARRCFFLFQPEVRL